MVDNKDQPIEPQETIPPFFNNYDVIMSNIQCIETMSREELNRLHPVVISRVLLRYPERIPMLREKGLIEKLRDGDISYILSVNPNLLPNIRKETIQMHRSCAMRLGENQPSLKFYLRHRQGKHEKVVFYCTFPREIKKLGPEEKKELSVQIVDFIAKNKRERIPSYY